MDADDQKINNILGDQPAGTDQQSIVHAQERDDVDHALDQIIPPIQGASAGENSPTPSPPSEANPFLTGVGGAVLGAGAGKFSGMVTPKPTATTTLPIHQQFKEAQDLLNKHAFEEILANKNAHQKALDLLRLEISNPDTLKYMESPARNLIPTPEQHTRIITGGEGDTLGTTGRQRGAYNWETQRASAGASGPVRAMGQVSATPAGLNIPSSLVYETHDPVHEDIAKKITEARQAAAKAEAELATAIQKNNLVRNVVKELGGGLPIQSIVSKALGKVGEFGNAISRIPGLSGALSGFGTAAAGQEAYNRYKRGDYAGTILPAIEAAGSAASLVPHPIVKGLGAGIAAGAGGLDYLLHK
jgi:hypothetical protein